MSVIWGENTSNYEERERERENEANSIISNQRGPGKMTLPVYGNRRIISLILTSIESYIGSSYIYLSKAKKI